MLDMVPSGESNPVAFESMDIPPKALYASPSIRNQISM